MMKILCPKTFKWKKEKKYNQAQQNEEGWLVHQSKPRSDCVQTNNVILPGSVK